MPKETTLLAHLVPRLTSQGEDAATDALAFILNQSEACRRALDGVLRGEGFDLQPICRVETQVTYEDGSRPDMVGYDEAGSKRLVVESKFWASLLEGQASGYFGQLVEEGPGALLFIAPEIRLETLWAEIRRQMERGESRVRLRPVETGDGVRRARVVGSDKRLMLVSWAALLDRMAAAVPGDSQVSSDIGQLRGLAQREDDDAFLPMNLQEFSPSLPRRMRWLNHLLDEVVDGRGVPEGWMSVRNLRATPQRDGYGRYFRFPGVDGSLFLCVNYWLWATSGDTPLWLWIGPNVPVDGGRLMGQVPMVVENEYYGTYDVPIHLKLGAEYGEVREDVIEQVRKIMEFLDTSEAT